MGSSTPCSVRGPAKNCRLGSSLRTAHYPLSTGEAMSKKIKELELNHLRQTFKGVRDMVLLEPLKLD